MSIAGVWSKKAIKQDETYGPFLGIKRKLAEVNDDTYSWEVRYNQLLLVTEFQCNWKVELQYVQKKII